MADSPASDFPHIFWRRLKRTDQRGKATRPAVPPQPPLRPNAAGHRQQVARQAGEAVDKLVEQRRAIGVKPQHLLVLEMEFVQAAQRDGLEKMGARILDEGERRVPLDDPVYCVPLAFDTAAHRQAFESLRSLAGHGISRVRRDRGTHGAPHELRVTACFEKLEDAKAFWKNAALRDKHHFQVGKAPPKKEATEVRHAWVVEFPDLATAESFRGQRVAGGQSASGLGALAPAERANLLDAIDTIRALEPADRTGGRLQAEGVPDGDEFAVDVDLWHPGDARQVGAEIKAFRDLVARHGGRVTDGPTPVAGTFFIARVKGNAATLDAVLSYDRVAFADLPPQLPPMPATVFKPIQLPDGGVPPPADNAPLACLVDSGVLASHPLLTGWVHDERDFDSGELTEVDQVGHGTHLAGIVVYGDVYRCIQKQSWEPKVRVLSAKVMRNNNGYAGFAEDNDERIETQLRDAITSFRKENGCRVFNLSIGHLTRPYRGGRQLPWALVLDELARSLDVVLVVSAGNVPLACRPESARMSTTRGYGLRHSTSSVGIGSRAYARLVRSPWGAGNRIGSGPVDHWFGQRAVVASGSLSLMGSLAGGQEQRFMATRVWLSRVVFVAVACSLASGAAGQEPEIRVERDIVYGKGGREDLQLNLALPRGKGPFPAVVCIHGGGWYQGRRQDMDAMAELLARRGYVAAAVSYRLAPTARFPAQIEDCKAAVRWLRANAGKYHVNPDRIGAIGPSAGGHLACLLGVTDETDGLEGTGGNPEQSSRVQAVVSFFGRTNFTKRTWTKELEREIFVPLIGASFEDEPGLYKRISPVAYASRTSPPFLLFHGSEDKLVPPRDSIDMAEKLRVAGVSAKAVIVEGEGHGSSDWVEKWAKPVEQAVAFFDAHLKK